MWTPFVMSVILHHHTRYCSFETGGTPLYKDTVADLVEKGILQKGFDEREWTTTERGAALVQAWLDTPMPEMRWVDPRFDGRRDA